MYKWISLNEEPDQISCFRICCSCKPKQFKKFLQKIQSGRSEVIEFNMEINICVQDILPTRFMSILSKFEVYIINRVENRMEISTTFIRKAIFSSNANQSELCRDAVKSDIDSERI
ncbi:hypothetical protein HNY73_017444 [Argiope bruennichi]|uniref:Uncharacterized protein n=1 Tax=Argiope bruennichi TaxID=94029 RepID=A0A8T0EB25_ARGBR|nr:hypothetical protein HNY73_017444 [Argiope bruennichi]